MQGKKKVKNKRASKEDYEHRIDEVINLIADGGSNRDILVYMRQKNKLDDAQIYRYIRLAYQKLSEINETNIYASYVRSLSLKYEFLKQAMQGKDIELAFKISQGIDKLTGVEANAMLITANLEFSKLLFENMMKEFQIANESSDNKDERHERFLLAIQNRLGEIFEQAHPFATQPKQLESGEDGDRDEPVEKILDCVL